MFEESYEACDAYVTDLLYYKSNIDSYAAFSDEAEEKTRQLVDEAIAAAEQAFKNYIADSYITKEIVFMLNKNQDREYYDANDGTWYKMKDEKDKQYDPNDGTWYYL